MITKILITAGHAGSTAYALIQAIKSKKPDCKIVFVGSSSAIEGTNIPTLENTYFPKIGVSYIKIITGRLQRKFTLWTIPSILKIPIGFIHAFIIMIKVRPNVTVSFGGFSAFPIVISSKLLRIPVVIHEQTTSAGRANMVSSYFADKIALSRKESLKYFPLDKCQIVGNPISSEVSSCKNKKLEKRKYAILITGGSRGSKIINENIKLILPDLLKKFTVYHQTGLAGYEDFEKIHLSLNPELQKKYQPFPTVEMWNWYKYLRDSDFIISRSGANIVSESMYLNMPSILIPLPFSFKDEQYKNALQAKHLGLAEIISESHLSAEALLEKIDYVSRNWKRIVENAKAPNINDSKAANKLYEIISEYA